MCHGGEMKGLAKIVDEGEDFEARVEALRGRVMEACREYERLIWLIGQLGAPPRHRDVEELEVWATAAVVWPGQREKALAALAVHPSPRAAEVLEAVTVPEELAMLRRLALSYRSESGEGSSPGGEG